MRQMWKPALAVSLLVPLSVLAAPGGKAPPPTPPQAEKQVVKDTYHGVEVEDPYQWMEKSDDPKVQAWTEAQNTYTRSVLDELPGREALRQRMGELMRWQSPSWYGLEKRGGLFFAMKMQPPRPQPLLVVMSSVDDPASERVLLDPAAFDETGKTSLDFFVPTHDGGKVAVSLSKGGSESGDVYVFDVATGKALPGEVVPRVNGGTAGGSVAWTADGTGFFYTRYPRGQERAEEDLSFYQQVYFHRLGTPTEKDTYELGKDFPRIAMTRLKTSEDGRYVLAVVANGDGGEFAVYLRGPSGSWARLARFEDKVVGATFGEEGMLYLLSRKEAPRGKVLRLPLATPSLEKATVVVPQGEAALQWVVPGAGRLYLLEQLGGPSRVRMVDLKGHELGVLPSLPVSSVWGLERLEGDEVLFGNSSFVQPPAWYRYSAKDGKVTKTALVTEPPPSRVEVEVVREVAVSKDGTRVPLNILKPKGLKLNGNNPTLLTGYGGFNISITPGFSKVYQAWLEQGGVVAIANLRGGSEFGEEWHQQGMLTRKQNVFDDFHACAKRLVEKKYTKPARLGIQGGSNGGLLMGAAVTQHPEAYGAVVARVGLYDMLRVELTPNGQFNTTEYGTVKDAEQFKALYGYSPYHRVVEGTKYPAMLFTSGANDPRVDPFHSRKMVARLQAATSSKKPVMLRANAETGHGAGTPLAAQIEEQVDLFTFFFHELRVRYKPVSSSARKAKPAKAPTEVQPAK